MIGRVQNTIAAQNTMRMEHKCELSIRFLKVVDFYMTEKLRILEMVGNKSLSAKFHKRLHCQ